MTDVNFCSCKAGTRPYIFSQSHCTSYGKNFSSEKSHLHVYFNLCISRIPGIKSFFRSFKSMNPMNQKFTPPDFSPIDFWIRAENSTRVTPCKPLFNTQLITFSPHKSLDRETHESFIFPIEFKHDYFWSNFRNNLST